MSENGRVKELTWNVGKFTYALGSDKPIHFMELPDFIVNTAVEYSQFFLVRSCRKQKQDSGAAEDAVERWLSASAATDVSKLAAEYLADSHPIRLLEVYGGLGHSLESIRYFAEKAGEFLCPSEYISYDNNNENRVLSYLNRGERIDIRTYSLDQKTEFLQEVRRDGPSLLVYNQNRTIRADHEPNLGWEEVIRSSSPDMAVVLALRCGALATTRTTVRGRRIFLPDVPTVLNRLSKWREGWYYRVESGFDEGWFLPDGQAPSSLLLACTWPTAQRGFRFLTQHDDECQ